MTATEIESSLLRVSAAMLHCPVFLSPFREDHPKRTPRRIIKAAEDQQDQLQKWAMEIAAAALLLRKARTDQPTTPK